MTSSTKIPMVGAGQRVPVKEVALQRTSDFEVQRVNSFLDLASKTVVPWVNQALQASANHKVIDEYTNQFLPSIAKMKEKALESGNYAGFRVDANNSLGQFFAGFKDAYHQKAVEGIKDQKTAWLGQEILSFETEGIAANEAGKLNSIMESMSNAVIEDPSSLSQHTSSLKAMQGNFSVAAGSFKGGAKGLLSYTRQLADTAMQGAIDSYEGSRLDDYFAQHRALLSPQHQLSFDRQIQKKQETLAKANVQNQLAEDIFTKKVPFEPLNAEHKQALEVMAANGKRSVMEIATATSFVAKEAIANLQGAIIAGGPGALEAAQTVNSLTKMNTTVAGQIGTGVQANATKFLRSFAGNGDSKN